MRILAIMLLVFVCTFGRLGWAEDTVDPPVVKTEAVVENITAIEANTINDLRTAINAKRSKCGMGAYQWSDPTLTNSSKIRLAHITQMMDAVKDMYTLAPSRPMSLRGVSSATAFTPISKDGVVRRNNILEISYALANVTCCGDGVCNGPETSQNCGIDGCAPTCGDNICEASEGCSKPGYCQNDCGVCAAAPVNGAYGSNWSACSVTCGGGTQTALCDNPAPANGGTPCALPAPTQACNPQACPVNGGYGFWMSTCTGALPGFCPSGIMTQICNNPVPANGGAPCPLPAPTQACPCPAQWTDTGCVNGMKTKTCVIPPTSTDTGCPSEIDGSLKLTEKVACSGGIYTCSPLLLDPHARLCTGTPPTTPTPMTLLVTCPATNAECTATCESPFEYYRTRAGVQCMPKINKDDVFYYYQGKVQAFIPGPGTDSCNGLTGSYGTLKDWYWYDVKSDKDFCTNFYNKSGIGGCYTKNCTQESQVKRTTYYDYPSTPTSFYMSQEIPSAPRTLAVHTFTYDKLTPDPLGTITCKGVQMKNETRTINEYMAVPGNICNGEFKDTGECDSVKNCVETSSTLVPPRPYIGS